MEKIELGNGWYIQPDQNPAGEEGYSLYSPDGWEKFDLNLSRLKKTAKKWMVTSNDGHPDEWRED